MDNKHEAASRAPSTQMRNDILDPETGDTVSKSEYKRRQKARLNNIQRATRTLHPDMPRPIDPSQYFQNRSQTILALRAEGVIDPYPHKFEVTTSLPTFATRFSHLERGQEEHAFPVSVGGRVHSKRTLGNHLVFYEIHTQGTQVQIVCQSASDDDAYFKKKHQGLHLGDIIGVKGHPGRTSPRGQTDGELSIFAEEIVLLCPCLHAMTKANFGYQDQEQRYRNRHIDLMMNPEVRSTLVARAQIIDYIRKYLKDREFLEVETPMMNQVAGGATAKPFETFHNAYRQPMFLRVAPELYLKQLVVGGIERVFEIGKQFRNESADTTHNPEFTTCEFYMAFADVHDLMSMTEELVSGLVQDVCGGMVTPYGKNEDDLHKINWAVPWRRIEMMPALEQATGEHFPPADQLHTSETNGFLLRLLDQKNIVCSPPLTNARMLDALVGHYLESTCKDPTFIVGHPQIMSPLAKQHRAIPGLCERFEVFVCQKEIINAYTELNDPHEQRRRFEEQARQRDQGDGEAQMVDEIFCQSLEWGLPPTGGFGMGIDRMAMFLTNNASIRDVLTFPFMKNA